MEYKDKTVDAKREIYKLRGDFKWDKCKFCKNDLTHHVKKKANEHKLTISCYQCNFKSTKRGLTLSYFFLYFLFSPKHLHNTTLYQVISLTAD